MSKPRHPLTDKMKLHNAGVFVGRIMKRIKADPRVAWYFDPMTQSFDDLCGIMALATGISIDEARAEFVRDMTFERPKGKHEDKYLQALRALVAVKPSNWDDTDDPEHAAAWRRAIEALQLDEGAA